MNDNSSLINHGKLLTPSKYVRGVMKQQIQKLKLLGENTRMIFILHF